MKKNLKNWKMVIQREYLNVKESQRYNVLFQMIRY